MRMIEIKNNKVYRIARSTHSQRASIESLLSQFHSTNTLKNIHNASVNKILDK